jgi:Cu/Ag efflux protein CusF
MKKQIVLMATVLAFTASSASAQESEVKKVIEQQLVDNATVDVVPGRATYTSRVELMAVITKIDQEAREVEVRGPRGNVLTLEAGPDIKNFDQLKVGDEVVAEYERSISLTLDKGQHGVVGTTESDLSSRAKPGEKPAAAAGAHYEIVAEVVELDKTSQSVVVRGPEQTMEFEIEDPDQFNLIELGDMVTLVVAEAIAIEVREAPARK